MNIFLCYILVTIFTISESRRFPREFNRYDKIKVIKVISGNLILVKKLNTTDNPLLIRLADIDSPQLNQSHGIDAKKHLVKLLENSKGAKIRMLVKKIPDRLGRVQARIYVGRKDINGKMVTDGFAWCENGHKCPFGYKVAMKIAKFRKIGLWKNKKQIRPWKSEHSKTNKKDTKKDKKKIVTTVTLEKVVDGDTIYVTRKGSSDKTIIKVRMVGIDTPEMKQSFGPESKNHLQTILSNLSDKPLSLVIQGKDKYGRTLAVVMSGSTDVNKKMVEDGYAWCYRHKDCPESYRIAMINAQKKRKGLFVQEKIVTPWDWRKEQKS